MSNNQKRNRNRGGKLRNYLLFALCAISIFYTSLGFGFEPDTAPVGEFFLASGLVCTMIASLFAVIIILVLTPE